MSIPSLQDLCTTFIARSLPSQIEDYYLKYPIAKANELSIQKKDGIIDRIQSLFTKQPLAPEDKIAAHLPLTIAYQISPLNPWLLSAIEAASPMNGSLEKAWLRCFDTRFDQPHPPSIASGRDTYLVRHLLKTYSSSGEDFRKAQGKDIALFVKGSADIETIEITERTPYLDDNILTILLSNSKKIHRIHLRGGHNISEKAMSCFVRSSPHLTHFKAGAFTITCDLLKELKKCTKLRYADLTLTSQSVTFEELKQLLLSLKKLEKVEIRDTVGMTDEHLADLLSQMPSLRYLHIEHSELISSDFLHHLLSKRSIEYLSFQSCLKLAIQSPLMDLPTQHQIGELTIKHSGITEEFGGKLTKIAKTTLIK